MVRVVFLHPDLGIGGAEKAVVDATLALQSSGHTVQMITSHHDTSHCFPETKDGTLNVLTVGQWLPRSIFGLCFALCAYLRMIYAAIYLVYFSELKFDIIFCDQISACIPVLKRSKAKVLFYCHFPDLLLTGRKQFLKALYRMPIDWLEEKTTGMADHVLVNSKFTESVFHNTFSSLQHIDPEVLYPIPNLSAFDGPVTPPSDELLPSGVSTLFLSINRYERKKNLGLAIKALGKLRENQGNLSGVHLVIAGGYDNQVKENTEHFIELKKLVTSLNLDNNVSFLRSISDDQKKTLLRHATSLLYTPDHEHFGIVPIEAMYMKCPPIAVNSGGPMESISDNESGFLCDPTVDSFVNAMVKFIKDPSLKVRMGNAGHDRVCKIFSFTAFTEQLDGIVTRLCTISE